MECNSDATSLISFRFAGDSTEHAIPSLNINLCDTIGKSSLHKIMKVQAITKQVVSGSPSRKHL
ncbi:hypothetical protein GBA52_022763 [Prunus armeniaca]|nr:hypothetical protein GBA52_022763 [Prunus armeniaca]